MARWGIAVAYSVLAILAVMVLAAIGSAAPFLHPNPLLPLDPVGKHLYSGLLGLSLGALVVVLTPLVVEKVKAARTLHLALRPVARSMSPWAIPVIAPTSALVEELFFRGWLQQYLESLLSPIAGVILQALVFGLVHYAPRGNAPAPPRQSVHTPRRPQEALGDTWPPRPHQARSLPSQSPGVPDYTQTTVGTLWRWAWVAWASIVGLLLGSSFLLTGSLLGPVVAHAVINGLNLRYLRRHDPDSAPRSLGGLLSQRG